MPKNPFGGAIALGFQLACFIETQIDEMRAVNGEAEIIKAKQLPFSMFELTFAGIVKPGNEVRLDVKPAKLKSSEQGTSFSSRLILKAEGKPVIMGYKRELDTLPSLIPNNFPSKRDIQDTPDRTFINDKQFFVKHKYMIVGNAKNFLTSAFAEQSLYIDEFEDKVNFPQMYPMGLLSSALLERAQADKHDLRLNPMIYVSHKLVISKPQLAELKSGDKLSIVVSEQLFENEQKPQQRTQYCLAYANEEAPLYIAKVELLPLSEIVE